MKADFKKLILQGWFHKYLAYKRKLKIFENLWFISQHGLLIARYTNSVMLQLLSLFWKTPSLKTCEVVFLSLYFTGRQCRAYLVNPLLWPSALESIWLSSPSSERVRRVKSTATTISTTVSDVYQWIHISTTIMTRCRKSFGLRLTLQWRVSRLS